MGKGRTSLWKIDRVLLAIYLIAMFGLLTFPIGGPDFRILNIGIDKWMHSALFGGLAVFVRWNLSETRHAVLISIGTAFIVAVTTELAQGLVEYRKAESWDLLAGLLGAMLGAVTTNRIVLSPVPQKPIGFLVGIVGLMVAVLFVLADVIGLGSSNLFGMVQLAGTALGALIVMGGAWVYLTGNRSESPAS